MKKKLKIKMKLDGATLPPIPSHEVYDTEVDCEKCGTRLYVSPEDATLVLASFRSIGIAGLVCPCGHIQFIDAALRLLTLPIQNRSHD